jgi:RNA polymerase primary sigma factor
MTRRLRELDREERRLLAELGREPSAAELAGALDWLPEEVAEARDQRRTTVSLDEAVGSPDGNPHALGALIADDADHAPDARAVAAALRSDVRTALRLLSPRERAVVTLRYGIDDDPATVAETARRLRLRAGDVRRLEELALRKLRAAPETAALAA